MVGGGRCCGGGGGGECGAGILVLVGLAFFVVGMDLAGALKDGIGGGGRDGVDLAARKGDA